MKNSLAFLILIFSLISCSSKVSDDEISKLNGYWEIEEVILPDGTKKEYTINSTIDYFEIKGKEGIRKKVMPQIDGTYKVNGLSEVITIADEDKATFIQYKTDYASWKEEIIALDEDELVVKNEQGIEYHYIKPEPFTVK